MLRPAVMSLLLLAAAGQAAEEEIEPLDGAFLDYLANMEGDTDDWTLLADAAKKPTASEASTAKPAPASKEPAEPAVDKK
jgi:hypothetical protein